MMYQYIFELNETDYITFYEEHCKQSLVVKKLMWGCRLLFPLIILWAGYGMTNRFENLFGILLYGGVALVWGIFFPKIYMRSIKRVSKRMLKESKDPSLYDRRIVTISNEGLSEEIPEHGMIKKWKGVLQTLETDQYLFLYVASQEAVILPKEVIGDTEQLEALKCALVNL